jgi:glycosyltransferase involved in cell wall biosynthesis
VIYNGKDLAKFEAARPYEFRKKYNWSHESLLIGYVGQFTDKKGALDFVEAARMILEKEKKCRFLLIGRFDSSSQAENGVMKQIKKLGLENEIVLPGWINEIESAYASLDALVIPSRYGDPAPNVCIEAMAAGIPVVATDGGGIPELVKNEETGFIVEKNNPSKIADRIISLINNTARRKRMGEKGRERAIRMFDIQKNAKQVEEILLRNLNEFTE